MSQHIQTYLDVPLKHRLNFLLDNQAEYRSLDLLEPLLVATLLSARGNCTALDILLSFRPDIQKMRAAGEPLPGNGPFEVFRGVSGTKRQRRVKAPCWTSNLDCACYFALFYSLDNPAVYRAEMSADDVYFFSDAYGEKEFWGHPRRIKKIAPDEMHSRAARFEMGFDPCKNLGPYQILKRHATTRIYDDGRVFTPVAA